MADKYLCRACSKTVTATKNDRYRSHTDGDGNPCQNSSEVIPEDLLTQAPSNGPAEVPEEGKDFARCPHCSRNVKLTRLGYYEPHEITLRGGDKCPNGGVRFRPLKPTEEVPLPGDEVPEEGVYAATHPKVSAQMEVEGVPTPMPAGTAPVTATPTVGGAAPAPEAVSSGSPTDETYAANIARYPMAEGYDAHEEGPNGEPLEVMASALSASFGASTETPSPVSTSTSTPSAPSSAGSEPSDTPSSSPGPFRLGKKLSLTIGQPFSPFLQPVEYTGAEKPEPMGDLAKELATRIKETFYSYDNRKSQDNRSAQTTLGPSEIGTPCDRRLAMALMGIPAVNPGGDGWAAFVGTCGHVGMGEVFTFADAGTGRYAVELPVFTGHPVVPRGTTDLLDRRDGTVVDWKFMGAYSLKKFKLEGPSSTYRVQAHVYGYGAERGGEKVRNVAVVGLPRAGGSLDDMHVWTEKYDRKVALEALNRVEDIAQKIGQMSGQVAHDGTGPASPMEAAQTFPTADDCRYCPFYLKNDKEMNRGCPGS